MPAQAPGRAHITQAPCRAASILGRERETFERVLTRPARSKHAGRPVRHGWRMARANVLKAELYRVTGRPCPAFRRPRAARRPRPATPASAGRARAAQHGPARPPRQPARRRPHALRAVVRTRAPPSAHAAPPRCPLRAAAERERARPLGPAPLAPRAPAYRACQRGAGRASRCAACSETATAAESAINAHARISAG